MKIRNITCFAHLAFVCFLFSSCLGDTDRIRVIENNSDFSVSVQITKSNGDFVAWYLAPHYSENIFFETESGSFDTPDNPADGINYMAIWTVQGDSCIKDYRIPANWEVKVDKTKNVPASYRHEYTFVINNNDF